MQGRCTRELQEKESPLEIHFGFGCVGVLCLYPECPAQLALMEEISRIVMRLRLELMICKWSPSQVWDTVNSQ